MPNIEIKRIENDNFLPLAALHAQFHQTLPVRADPFAATLLLVQDITQRTDFRAWGLFEDSKLSGFVIGYAESKKSFYFSGLYVIIKLNKSLKQFIEHCFTDIAKDGYTSWEVDCTNKNITSMMEKYGAAPMYTRYKKELGENNG